MFLLAVVLYTNFASIAARTVSADTYYIPLEDFRWTRFPLRVYVDMNEWSIPEYAVGVREALDSWVKSIWNYTQAYNDTSLSMINYVFYVSNVNATQNYDVYFTFTADKMPPDSNTVGLTTYKWDAFTHEPISPITINITTYSGGVSSFFVKNVAMHEFGHALGLGHAGQANTWNGPELMYYASSKNQVIFPSTLDVYGLTRLYAGDFGQNVQLPPYLPYVMLAEGTVPPPEQTLLYDYGRYIPLVGLLLLLIVAVAVVGHLSKEKKIEQEKLQPPPPSPDG
jgi:predicted Zn-dependent protease